MNEKLLNELIPAYYENKERMENYKRLVDKQNKEIKEIIDVGSYEANGYKATVSISTRVDMDENKLLNILKANNIDVIKTREYVDMDELENKIYHNDIPKDVLKLIGECKSAKEIKQLRVTKKK